MFRVLLCGVVGTCFGGVAPKIEEIVVRPDGRTKDVRNTGVTYTTTDGTITETQKWSNGPGNLAGGVYKFNPSFDVGDGTCRLIFPGDVAYLYFHEAHHRADYPRASNEYHFVYADRNSENSAAGTSFTVNYNKNKEYEISQMQIWCDQSDLYTYAIYSFPQGSQLDAETMSMLRRRDNKFDPDAQYCVHLGHTVDNFQVYDGRIHFGTNDYQNYCLMDVPSDAAIPEFEFSWRYKNKGYFAANTVIIDGNMNPPTDVPTVPDTTTIITTTVGPNSSTSQANPTSSTKPSVVTEVDPETPSEVTTEFTGRGPSCAYNNVGNFNWKTCAVDSESDTWYGLSNQPATWRNALDMCEKTVGPDAVVNGRKIAQLIGITDEDVDKCLYDILHWNPVYASGNKIDQEFLTSGRYINESGSYVWTESLGDNAFPGSYPMDYTNWLTPPTQELSNKKPCVSALLRGNVKYFDRFGWQPYDCNTRLNYICRINCAELNPTAAPIAASTKTLMSLLMILIISLLN